MVHIAFACLLACEIGHFACLIVKLPLSALPLVSIESGRYSTDWTPPSPCLIAAWLHQPSRLQLPSSSIVDEFNFILVAIHPKSLFE